jgi:hypothetical protein
MKPDQSGLSNEKKTVLPQGMRLPRVRTFKQRVWEEETIRALREMKEFREGKPRVPIEERKIVCSFSHDPWYRIIWRAKVKIELNKFKHKRSLDGLDTPRKIEPPESARTS